MILTFMIDVVVTKNEVSYAYHIENNTSILSRLTLNASGNLVTTVWLEQSKKWQVVFSYPRDICDGYNNCGGYGSCSAVNMVTKSCACLDQYRLVPKDDDLSGGCVRRTPLACKNGSEAFIKFSRFTFKYYRFILAFKNLL
ncbi:S-locus lectin protein kinase family protein [Artemisia annua]|uniref:S-locus lectin protein kinase family protein n=1 Tax=Artemisia annua TaxID=35608 RepID=A0A2U1KYJ8_ARTAN|nr:S-locus lectin protein kinase family protein [Artemisia annua]